MVVRNRHIFDAASNFAFLVEILMSAWIIVQMCGSFVGAAVFLSGFTVLRELSISMHGKASITDRCATRQLGRILCIPIVERNHTVSVVKLPDGVIDSFDIIGLIPNKGSFLHGQVAVGFL